jgi:hypothetical protein
MSHVHSLRFDALESRELLTKAHHAVAHGAPAVATAPLVLDGTLIVDNKAATTTMNADGSLTTTVPVAGRLGALGEVHGLWHESVDAYGDYTGPDTLQLRAPKGTFLVTFNNQNSPRAHQPAHSAASYEHPQRVYSGTGAYTKASESGSIDLTTNAARTRIDSLTLDTLT